MTKKILAGAMAVIMALAAVACGSEPAANKDLTAAELTAAVENSIGEYAQYCPVVNSDDFKAVDFLNELMNGMTELDTAAAKEKYGDVAAVLEAMVAADANLNMEMPADEEISEEDKEFYDGLKASKESALAAIEFIKGLFAQEGTVAVEITEDVAADLNELFITANGNVEMTRMMFESMFSYVNGEETVGLAAADMDKFAISTTMMMTKAYGVGVFVPAEGKEEHVFNAVNGFVELMKKNFEFYLRDQYDIAMAAKVEKLDNGTVILVMTDDGENVYNSLISAINA